MVIAQLTHLHLTIPLFQLVPSESYPIVPLSQESTISRRVSFVRDVAVIESSLLFSPAEEPESLPELTKRDTEALDRGLIQFTQQDYVL